MSFENLTAFQIATTVIFASLGVIGLAMGLLARRYSFRVLATGLLGLFMLTAAATYLTLRNPGNFQERIAKLESRIEGLKSQLVEANGKVAKLEEENRDLDSRIAGDRLTCEKAESDLGQAKKTIASCQKKVTRLEQENERLKSEPKAAKPNRPDSEPPDPQKKSNPPKEDVNSDRPSPRTGELQEELNKGIDNTSFVLKSIDRREYVEGAKGSWYRISLKPGGKPLEFSDRQFRARDKEADLRKSAKMLNAEVLKRVLAKTDNLQLYVRGSADPRRVAGETEDPARREFGVLPRRADGNYAARKRQHVIQEQVRNEDLPTLRADWLRGLVNGILKVPGKDRMPILENPPGPGQKLTADLILYVKW